MAELIKIDKNGNKHFRGIVKCDRCGGAGGANQWAYTGWTCYKCGGSGEMVDTWIEYSPEYQAKIDAKKEAQRIKEEEERKQRELEIENERKKKEAEKIAKELEIKAQKSISQYVGSVGEKIEKILTYDHSAYWKQKSFTGYGTETMYLHCFRDESENLIVWKTTKGIGWLEDPKKDIWIVPETGDRLMVKGTIKEHKEYEDEKQTVLTRCKIERS